MGPAKLHPPRVRSWPFLTVPIDVWIGPLLGADRPCRSRWHDRAGRIRRRREHYSPVSRRLKERGVPFLIYSGHSDAEAVKQGVPYVSKPASHEELVAAVEDLIQSAEA